MFPTNAQEVDAVLSILAVVIPAIALSNVLGFQYLLVDRKEKTFNIIIGVAAVVNVIIAYFLVLNFQVRGMALAWVIIEWLIAFFIAVVVFGMGRNSRLEAKG
jgi:O-antigen/teichoic acid export membrane protein